MKQKVSEKTSNDGIVFVNVDVVLTNAVIVLTNADAVLTFALYSQRFRTALTTFPHGTYCPTTLMYDAVIWFQDYFFGQMLQDSWENARCEYVPRRKNSRNA